MRSLLLFLIVLVVFGGTAFGALQLMDSGEAPAAIESRRPKPQARNVEMEPTVRHHKPTVAPKPRKSAAERSGDRWVNQAEAVCRQFERDIAVLMQNRTPRTTSVALYRTAYNYERAAVTRLHRLPRPRGSDAPVVDRMLRTLDRHLSVFDALLDAIEARNAARAHRLAARLAALTEPAERAAAELGAFTCAYGG